MFTMIGSMFVFSLKFCNISILLTLNLFYASVNLDWSEA